jgi:hypothetical protein
LAANSGQAGATSGFRLKEICCGKQPLLPVIKSVASLVAERANEGLLIFSAFSAPLREIGLS